MGTSGRRIEDRCVDGHSVSELMIVRNNHSDPDANVEHKCHRAVLVVSAGRVVVQRTLGLIRWRPGGPGRRSVAIALAEHSPHTGSVPTVFPVLAGPHTTIARGERRRRARTGRTFLP